jgi:hypothetical protein
MQQEFELPVVHIRPALMGSEEDSIFVVKEERTKPWNSQKSNSEEEIEEKEHHSRNISCRFRPVCHRACQNRHACTLASSRKEHQFPTTKSEID